MRGRERECRRRVWATRLRYMQGVLHRVIEPRLRYSASDSVGCRLGQMLGCVDFFQNYKVLLFLYDLRAVSLDKTEGSTVLFLALTCLRLPRSTMDVFQWG